jgi:hypothetical protein
MCSWELFLFCAYSGHLCRLYPAALFLCVSTPLQEFLHASHV